MNGAMSKSVDGGSDGQISNSPAVVPEEKDLFGAHAILKKYKTKLRVEVVGLFALMVVVWGLLTLPIIFYFIPSSLDEKGISNHTGVVKNVSDGPFECREDFFRDEQTGACVPECPNWRQDNRATQVTLDVVIKISYTSGFIVAIAIVIISIVRRETMFSFPNSLVVYLTMVYIVQNFFYIVTYFDRAGLYCSSKNLYFTFTHVTSFCIISGMVQVYSTLASAIWWLMLTISLFWKLWFPFNARLRESKHQIKYIHLGCVLIGVLVPLIPIIGLMSDFAARVNSSASNLTFVDGGMGFTSIRFPPVPCNGNSKALVFYTNILPTNIILAVGINIIILIFWLVHKQHSLFKASQLKKNPFGISVAERKLLIVFCYYVISTVINLTAFSEFASHSDVYEVELNRYFACELSGHDPSNPCDRSRIERIWSEVPVIMAFGLHGILPLFSLIFVISVQDLREKCPRLFCMKKTTSSIKKDFSTGDSRERAALAESSSGETGKERVRDISMGEVNRNESVV